MTTNDTKNLTGVDLALALDSLDESPIDRLWEDEDGIFTAEEATIDWADVPDYMSIGYAMHVSHDLSKFGA